MGGFLFLPLSALLHDALDGNKMSLSSIQNCPWLDGYVQDLSVLKINWKKLKLIAMWLCTPYIITFGAHVQRGLHYTISGICFKGCKKKYLVKVLGRSSRPQGVSLSILKLLCMTVFNDRKCPSEECDFMYPKLPLYDYVATHFIQNHMHKSTSWNYPKLAYWLNHLLL